jgi:hypothetical protein
MFIDLQPIIHNLSNITDESLKGEIRNLGLAISDDKFSNAFACYGLTKRLSSLETRHLRGGVLIPDKELELIRWKGVFVLRAYITFVYMRSEHLEHGLDNVSEYSSIKYFKEFFRKAKKKNKVGKEDRPLGQRFRNSLSHGTFYISNDLRIVSFEDIDGWMADVLCKDFIDELCEQILRFYYCAFEVCRENKK